jgi:hypothetical protein
MVPHLPKFKRLKVYRDLGMAVKRGVMVPFLLNLPRAVL